MNFKAALKTRRGRLILAAVVLGMAGLCIAGLLPTLGVVPQGHLPEISLAAEEIPLPFSVPLFGDHIPNTLPATWITMVILFALGLGYRRATRSEGPPSRFQVALEAVLEAPYNFVEGVAGGQAHRFYPLLGTFLLFMAISN